MKRCWIGFAVLSAAWMACGSPPVYVPPTPKPIVTTCNHYTNNSYCTCATYRGNEPDAQEVSDCSVTSVMAYGGQALCCLTDDRSSSSSISSCACGLSCKSGQTQVSDCRAASGKQGGSDTSGSGGGSGGGGAFDVTGTYDTRFEVSAGGERTTKMSFVQTSNKATGEYKPSVDPFGAFDLSFTGTVGTGEWIQGSVRGPLKLTWSADGSSFTGTWDYAGGSGQFFWNGTRTSKTPTNLFPNGTGGTTTSGCKANSDCGTCKRCELSTGKCLSRLTC